MASNPKVMFNSPVFRCFSKENKEKKEAEDEYETVEEEITDDEHQQEITGDTPRQTIKLTTASGAPVIKDCYYETLGISKDANAQDVRAAYLSKAREFHPDKRPECLEFFTHVTKAYETLSDEHKRAIYDDESIPDEEYFTLQVGQTKINIFTVAMGVSMLAMTYVAYVQQFGAVQTAKTNGCPIDHSSR